MRMLLADDQVWLRFAIKLILELEATIEIVGEAVDTAQLIEMNGRLNPDIVLLDWELPGVRRSNAKENLLITLRANNRELLVIVLSGRPESCRAAMDAGANAFVSKADPPEKFLAALRKVEHSTQSVEQGMLNDCE